MWVTRNSDETSHPGVKSGYCSERDFFRGLKKALYAQMLELAKAAGFSSVEEFAALQGGRTPRKDKGVRLPPKYQNKDKTKTWSGKGRKPDWVIEHLASGGQIEALEIK